MIPKLDHYKTLADAFNLLGKKHFPDEWAGDEILVYDSLDSLVSSKNKYPKGATGLQALAHNTKNKLLVQALVSIRDDVLAQLKGAYEKKYTESEWEAFRLKVLSQNEGNLVFGHLGQGIAPFLDTVMRYVYVWNELHYLLQNGKLSSLLIGHEYHLETTIQKTMWLSNKFNIELSACLGAASDGRKGYVLIPDSELKGLSPMLAELASPEEVAKKALSEHARKAGSSKKSTPTRKKIIEEWKVIEPDYKKTVKTKLQWAKERSIKLIEEIGGNTQAEIGILENNLSNRIYHWICDKRNFAN